MCQPAFGLAVACGAAVVSAAVPTFQQMMDPAWMPHEQQGMRVEAAVAAGDVLHVVTTGARMALEQKNGLFVFRQRIGHEREVVRLRIDAAVGEPQGLRTASGMAFASFASPRFDLRANGDSLFLLHAVKPMGVTVERRIEPGFHASFKSNHVVFDEWGGFGLYSSHADLDDAFDPYATVTARYHLPADSVLCVGVCPPKPYDWERSITDRVVWHWSDRNAYPADEMLAAWSKFGNIFLLQSEVMLWKDWNLAFEPRLGTAEFARVRTTTHRHGARLIVYTSPYYFIKGTPQQAGAMNSFDNFRNWPAGTPTGENMGLFLAEIRKLMREHKPDGLYFDGQYFENPAALYALARASREIVGEDGILEWHSTNALGPGLCFLPQADAYVDFILRGEGREALYSDERYLRHFVSCYNSSNSIGVICNNTSRPTADLVRRLLAVNGRMHIIAGWLGDAAIVELVNREYLARLNDSLRAEVEKGVNERQAALPARIKALADEHRMLRSPPSWGEPVLRCAFDTMEGWVPSVSPRNREAFAVEADGLRVTAHASTYAYLTRPVKRRLSGFVVKLRLGTDTGASWGPAACARWPGGRLLRLGLRGDGLLQFDILGEQRLGPGFPRDQWVWLRARWGPTAGVIERSDEGQEFRRVADFEHGGALCGEAHDVSVGKVPYHGRPEDFTDIGPPGTSTVGEITLH